MQPGAVTESVERGPHVWEIRSLVPGRVKIVTYKIDTCHFLAWPLAVIRLGKDWLMRLSGILGDGAGGLISQKSNIIKLP